MVNYAQTGINFTHESWNEIVKKARKEKKIIFLDAYASWCGPCKWMAKNVFTDKKVGDYYNKNFVCAKIDMQKGEGPELAQKFKVRAFPTLLYIDAETQKVLHKTVGGLPADKFLQEGKIAKNPKERFGEFNQKYINGQLKNDEIEKYIKLLKKAYMPTDEVIDKYFKNVSKKNLTSQKSWQFLNEYVHNVNSESFKMFFAEKDRFSKKYGKNNVDNKILSCYGNMFMQILFKRNINTEQLNEEIKKLDEITDTEIKNIISSRVEMLKAQRYNRIDDYLANAKKLFSQIELNDFKILYEMAWSAYENGDADTQKEALKWAAKSVELNQNSANMDIYACLLFRNGEKDKAIKTEEKAIDLAKKEGGKVAELTKKLEEMKAGTLK